MDSRETIRCPDCGATLWVSVPWNGECPACQPWVRWGYARDDQERARRMREKIEEDNRGG